MPHFLDTFFIAPWILGHREIPAADKGSSEACAIKVTGICSRPSINTQLAHCSQEPLHQEHCSGIPCGDLGYRVAKGRDGWLQQPVLEVIGASVSPGCPELPPQPQGVARCVFDAPGRLPPLERCCNSSAWKAKLSWWLLRRSPGHSSRRSPDLHGAGQNQLQGVKALGGLHNSSSK